MPQDRFFLDTHFSNSESYEIEGDEAHHLQRVMRKKEGDTIELINGKCQLANAQITSCSKKSVTVSITSIEEKTPFPPHITICQGLCRLNRLETMVEKGVELGMHELWLFPADLSEKKELSSNQMKRLEQIAISAMKQCGRLDLPQILVKPPLYQWQSLPNAAFFGDVSLNAPTLFQAYHQESALFFFVGPESGFSQKEVLELKRLQAQGISLHPNILRTETASLAALSILFNLYSGR